MGAGRPKSHHVLQFVPAGGVCPHGIPDFGDGDSLTDDQREEVYHLLGVVPENVRAENAVVSFVDEHPRPADRFAQPLPRKRVRKIGLLDLEFQAALQGLGFQQPHLGQRRQTEAYARDARVIDLGRIGMQDVRGSHPALDGGHGRQGQALVGDVADGIDMRVRHALHTAVHRNSRRPVLNPGLGEIKP